MALSYLDIKLTSAHFPHERLFVRALRGKETISRLFDFEIELVSLDREGVDTGAMMGASVTVTFLWSGVEVRRLRGMIAEIKDENETQGAFRSYLVRVVPRAHRLAMIATQETFMDMTVPEIIEHKLRLVGLGKDYALRLSRAYRRREFVVQYGETDLAFVCRLAEHLGVSFFFEHHDGHEVMVFTDHQGGFRRPEDHVMPFVDRGEQIGVFDLSTHRRLVPSVYVVQDYNYRTPHVDLTSQHELADAYSGGVIEHGGHFKTPEEGQTLAQIRAEERRAGEIVYTGKSDLPGLCAGERRLLEGHAELPALELLVVEVEHEASLVVAGSGAQGEPSYANTFRAIPGDRTYRPPRVTPRPQIPGLVHGIVVAKPEGGDRYAQIDDQGRYVVRFLFDTATEGGRPASRPVRMMQNHSGENYGTHFPLRPGAEVLIAFVNGDLDRPVIVGTVPNPAKPSPVTNKDPGMHRIRTGAGIFIDIVDDF
jgi:type VI secretion system secreted protein VgrG